MATTGCCYPKLAGVVEYLDSLKGRVDLGVLEGLLNKVRITRKDIEPSCIFGARGYRRNTISSSEWYELLAICWRSGHCTPIHDHKGVSCAFKVIESGLVCPVATNRMAPGYVCAAKDEDIHQVANMQAPGTDLITLHIYSPPIKNMTTYCFATVDAAEAPEQYSCRVVEEESDI